MRYVQVMHSVILLFSYAECHDTVNNIVVVLLQRLDSLLSADTSLSHNQLNILSLKACIINFFAIVFFLLGRFLVAFDSLALVFRGIVVWALDLRLGCKLLSCGRLSLRVEVFDLGFAEDAASSGQRRSIIMQTNLEYSHPGVAARAFVNLGLADHEQNVLGPPQSYTSNALDVFQAEFGNGFACFLLVPAVYGYGCASRDIRLARILAGFI